MRWTDAVAIRRRAAPSCPAGRLARGVNWPALARGAAALHLCTLALLLGMAWQDRPEAGAAAGGVPALHLVFLIASGAAAALMALRRAAAPAAEDWRAAVSPSPQLLAQMSHELRTPLNAVIGFSEVMRQELHGPLGHARYQEYAAHISESGGQLLKASEDALAVAATMSALLTDRRTIRRKRVRAAALLEEAWAAVAELTPDGKPKLAAVNCGCEIDCDRRATGQALEHLLREALARTPPNAALEARGHCEDGSRGIEIRVRPPECVASAPATVVGRVGATCRRRVFDTTRNPTLGASDMLRYGPSALTQPTPGSDLRVILARSLLEMQGATLSLCADPAGSWSACVLFPTRLRRQPMVRRPATARPALRSTA